MLKYEHRTPKLTFEEKNSIIIKNSIDSILTSQLGENYIPYNYSELEIFKPKPFLELDSIYLLRSNLSKETKDENIYDRKLASYNREINRLKKKINDEKLYHSFKTEHIYIVKKDLIYQLHEDRFTFLPNYKLKVITPLLSTSLTEKEKDLFDYFNFQNYLFQTDYQVYDYQMDQLVYEKFNTALANETNNKSGLIHTILHCVDYIRKNNEFNEQKIAEKIAKDWILKNNYRDFQPEFSTLEAKKDNNETSFFVLLSKNKNGKEFARVVGEIDFYSDDFLRFLKKYI